MKVIKDANGVVINIGDWDYMSETLIAADGTLSTVINNPLPLGATEADEAVVTGWDGGTYVEGDPAAVKTSPATQTESASST